MDLSLADQLTIVLTATMASIGAAGVPGAGGTRHGAHCRDSTSRIALILGMDPCSTCLALLLT